MTQQNKNLETAVEFYRTLDASDLERASTVMAPGFQGVLGGNKLDVASWVAVSRMFMSAFPDGRHVFDLMEASGDYVLSHGHFTGTHTGEFHGIPATGRVITCSLTMIDKYIDGKLIQHYGDFDSAGLMQQLTQPEAA